jgi:CubicO group peptidase (beta-lactamase class C family)
VLLPLVSLAATLLGDPLVVRPPSSVGMSAERLAEVDRIVRRGIAVGAYPGAAVVIGRKGVAVHQRGYGRLSYRRNAAAVDPRTTIYDLASLTKAVCVATAVMILHDEGKLALETRIQSILPEFTGRWKERVTVAHLLSHRSGLPPGRRVWLTAKTPAEGLQQILTTRLNSMPGGVTDYSDLGPIILGLAIEKVSGMPLNTFCETRIYEPLGMHDTFYQPADSLKTRIAPTEQYPPRGHPAHGEVHDETAYTIGGISGNAGLFSTATDLAIFAQMMLNGGTYGSVRIVQEATVRRFTTVVADNRTYGWMSGAAGEQGSGEFLGPNTYGHAGYTGTSLWIDPDRQLFVVILTNRVHEPRARRPGIVMADVRHDVADVAALAISDVPTLRAVAWPRTMRVDLAPDWNPPTRTLVRRPTTTPRQTAASSPETDSQ